MKRLKAGIGIAIIAPMMVWAALAASADSARIFETNVTQDLAVSPGEPELAIDPTNPQNMAIIEWAVGSQKVPAATGKAFTSGDPAALANDGHVRLSTDGGKTWTLGPLAVQLPDQAPISADPAIAYGPDGTLYAVGVFSPKKLPSNMLDVSGFRVGIAMSRDGGRTFGKTEMMAAGPHRPWLRVDQKTGTVFVGTFGMLPTDYNLVDDSKQNGWLVAWKPHLTSQSEPRPTGGPDFGGAAGHHFATANGVVAAVFLLGPEIPESLNKHPPEAIPVPASLKTLIRDGTTSCSRQAPCLFFETSSDEGQHWNRHHVPLPPGGYSGLFPLVAADPSRKGRYAISFLSKDGMNQAVVVTDDAGKTWTAPYTIPEVTKGKDFKSWMDYGPSGVLGLMWKKQRDDLPEAVQTAAAPGQGHAPGFDVYTAISCDGGKHWLAPVRVNAESSPPGPNGMDDLSYIVLDARAAHLVWGDRRNVGKVQNAPGGMGGLQTFYGRVPFSAVSGGGDCGRK